MIVIKAGRVHRGTVLGKATVVEGISRAIHSSCRLWRQSLSENTWQTLFFPNNLCQPCFKKKEDRQMKTFKIVQGLLIVLSAVVFLLGILTVFHVFPSGLFILTTGGLQRMTDTLLLFSIAVGLYLIVAKKS